MSATRVMQFVTVFEAGGTERQFLNLALALCDRGIDLRFGCLQRSGRMLAELDGRGVPISEYAMRSFYSARFFRQQIALARDLARDGVEVVHAYNLYGNVFAVPAAKLAGVPAVIASVRDTGLYMDPVKRAVQRYACRFADLIIVNAEAVKTWLVGDGYPAEKIVVVRNGVDFSHIDAVPTAPPVRREYGIPADAPVLAVIARMCPSKGFDDAIAAMPTILARHPDAWLLVVGEELKATDGVLRPVTTYRDALAVKARALGVADRVIFTGYRADAPAIRREVTLVVQPSLTEGLSNSVLEAMAGGHAVLATPVGGTPEVLTHDQTGWLTPAGDPRLLADAASTLLSDPARRARLGAAAKQHIRGVLSVPRMVDATVAVYDTLLARKRARRAA